MPFDLLVRDHDCVDDLDDVVVPGPASRFPFGE